jgi:hypothetical protein
MIKIAANRNYRLSKKAQSQGQKVYVLERIDPDNNDMFEGVFSSQELAKEYAKTLTYGISLDKHFQIIDPTLDNGDADYHVVATFSQSELKKMDQDRAKQEDRDLWSDEMLNDPFNM